MTTVPAFSGTPPRVVDLRRAESQEDFITQMQRLLPHIPKPVRSMRIQQAQGLAVHLAGEPERSIRRNDAAVPFALCVSGVVDGLAGFLEAPDSAETDS